MKIIHKKDHRFTGCGFFHMLMYDVEHLSSWLSCSAYHWKGRKATPAQMFIPNNRHQFRSSTFQLAKTACEESWASSAAAAKVTGAEIVRGIRAKDSPDYSRLALARQPPVQVRVFFFPNAFHLTLITQISVRAHRKKGSAFCAEQITPLACQVGA